MHGENGTPATPDWLPDSPRCGNPDCRCRETYCQFLNEQHNGPCCGSCTHGFTSGQLKLPALWEGDQA